MAVSVINGKHVLFIGPVFYHYHEEIISTLREKGASVDFFPERAYNLKFGFYSRLGKAEQYQERYYNKILDSIGHTRYDYFFLIKGELLPDTFITELRKRNPKIICVQYQWDSAQRNKYLHLVPHFNKTLTFDRADAAQYNLEYLPLFYTEKIYQLSKQDGHFSYDLLMLGTYLPEREQALRKLIGLCDQLKLKLRYHLFLNKVHYYTRLLKGAPIKKDLVNFNSLPYEQVLKLYAQSRVIVDFSNVKQSGLSMRVIEALGAGRKLITTNKNITAEPFYDPRFISVIDIQDPEIDGTFVQKDYKFNEALTELHIHNWLERIFVSVGVPA